MAVANRKYGKDLFVFTVNTTQTLVAHVSNATINFMVSTIDATCLTDSANYNLANRDDFSISFSLVYDMNSTQITALIDLVGTLVTFTITAASGGETYSGSGILSRGQHNIPDGGQTLDFEIIPQGVALTK